MKLYKIGQPWQNEPLIENQTEFIDKKRLVLPVINEKLVVTNPGIEKVVQFCLTFLKGGETVTIALITNQLQMSAPARN